MMSHFLYLFESLNKMSVMPLIAASGCRAGRGRSLGRRGGGGSLAAARSPHAPPDAGELDLRGCRCSVHPGQHESVL